MSASWNAAAFLACLAVAGCGGAEPAPGTLIVEPLAQNVCPAGTAAVRITGGPRELQAEGRRRSRWTTPAP